MVSGQDTLLACRESPHLARTKITTYLACPDKYKWTYVDPRGKWYLKSKSYFSFGSSLHKVLQRFHDSGDNGVQTTDQAVAALEESWIEAGYSSQEEMMESMAEGKAIIEEYTETFLSEPVTSNTIYVEKLLRTDLGDFTLLGRVDRVDEHEDGTLEVIDYKSGRNAVDDEQVKYDLAMGIYQVLLSKLHAGNKVKATIIALRSNSRGTSSMSQEELAAFEEDLKQIGKEILDRDYENMVPVAKDLCESCDFLPLCRQHPDFTEQEPYQ